MKLPQGRTTFAILWFVNARFKCEGTLSKAIAAVAQLFVLFEYCRLTYIWKRNDRELLPAGYRINIVLNDPARTRDPGSDIEEMYSVDFDEFLLEIAVRVKLAIDHGCFRFEYFDDFEFIVLLRRNKDAIIIHAKLRGRFRSIMRDKDFPGPCLTADFSLLSCNELAWYRMFLICRNLARQFRSGDDVAFILQSTSRLAGWTFTRCLSEECGRERDDSQTGMATHI